MRFGVLVAENGDGGRPICRAVATDLRLELVDCAPDAAAAVAKAVELAADVLVLDEGIDGGAIAAAVEIGARMPSLPLVITHGEDEHGLVEALAAGASAYISVDVLQEELLQVIVDVARGDVVLSRRQSALVVEELRDPTRPRRRLERLPELTAREWQVLDMLNSELSTPEIAERLVLSPVTVRSHARSIRQKLARTSPIHH